MPKVLNLDKGAEEGVKELLRFLLENGRVRGVFTLSRLGENGAIAYSLITSAQEIDSAMPLFPLMPTNAGMMLSRLTLTEPASAPIAAVVRPCELRALVELIKRNQGCLDNLLLISPSCGGVYPLKMAADGVVADRLPQYWQAVGKGENATDIRPACQTCVHFAPYNADIVVELIGSKGIDKETRLLLNSEKAEQLTEGFGQTAEAGSPPAELDQLQQKREAERQKLFDETRIEGMAGLVNVFGRCISCHGCSKVCPICYCKLCFFESADNDYNLSTSAADLERRGGIWVPPGTIFYQLGRLTHVGISCVGCGMCDDVCPVNIPLSTIFQKVGQSVQELFGYVPGKDVAEPLPLTAFETEELANVEE